VAAALGNRLVTGLVLGQFSLDGLVTDIHRLEIGLTRARIEIPSLVRSRRLRCAGGTSASG